MSKKVGTFIVVCLVVSLSANVYLYSRFRVFQEAWLNQFITTSEIESILKASSTDLSFSSIRKISVARFGEDNVHAVNLEAGFSEHGYDRDAIGVNDTLLFFKDGLYYGSKANLRDH